MSSAGDGVTAPTVPVVARSVQPSIAVNRLAPQATLGATRPHRPGIAAVLDAVGGQLTHREDEVIHPLVVQARPPSGEACAPMHHAEPCPVEPDRLRRRRPPATRRVNLGWVSGVPTSMEPEKPSPLFPGLDAEGGQAGAGAVGADECVIVGIDGSAESHVALRWAMRYARRTGSPVEAVTAWQFPPPQPGTNDMMLTADDIQDVARRWLNEAVAGAGLQLGGGVGLYAVHGDPVDVLLERAGTTGLIVLGNKGRGAIAATVLGSVAQRCLHHARCPVVLVPAAHP